jgi:hypothetical protein
MITLRIPGTAIVEHNGEMFKVLARHKPGNYSREKLGHLVKYYGGDKILQVDGKLLICSTIQDADAEYIR